MGFEGLTKSMKASRDYTISDAIHSTNMKKGAHDVSPFDFEPDPEEIEEQAAEAKLAKQALEDFQAEEESGVE